MASSAPANSSATELLQLFRASGALLQGHFQLTSGLHSDQYFQCALVLQEPAHAERLCRLGAAAFAASAIATVVAPAVGGIVVGQEVARLLGARSIFAERKDGSMQLRRGFALRPGERVLVAEDVVTTGGSVREVIVLARQAGAEVCGVFAIVDRSGGAIDFGVRFVPAVTLQVRTYTPAACPLCRRGVPLEKPGSRGLQAPPDAG